MSQVQTYLQYAPSTTAQVQERADRFLVTVEVVMEHVEAWGREKRMRLTYACTQQLRVGQHVLCPPSRLGGKWTHGRVVALGATNYRGRVKYVKPLGRK